MAFRVFIVDDHDWLRKILTEYVEKLPDFEVCGVARSGEEALESLAEARADMLLIDSTLPRMSGADVVAAAVSRWPGLPCVMLSGHDSARHIEQAMTAGARGYVLKRDPNELQEALNRVMAGETYLSKDLRDPNAS